MTQPAIVREMPTTDDAIDREMDQVDRGLRSLEVDVLE